MSSTVYCFNLKITICAFHQSFWYLRFREGSIQRNLNATFTGDHRLYVFLPIHTVPALNIFEFLQHSDSQKCCLEQDFLLPDTDTWPASKRSKTPGRTNGIESFRNKLICVFSKYVSPVMKRIGAPCNFLPLFDQNW